MRKKITVVFLLFVFLLSFKTLNTILLFKFHEGEALIHNLYKQKDNSIDVLFIGSSHVFEDVNTQTLFDEYGIASFLLSAMRQPFWNSYYYLREALKTQRPKLVVLEGFSASMDWSHFEIKGGVIKNNFGLNNNLLKVKSLLASSPRIKRDDYFLGYRLYHSRYNKLGPADRKALYQKGWRRENKGLIPIYVATKTNRPDQSVTEVRETLPLHPKHEKFFLKIVDLCKKENIPLLVFVSPYELSRNDQKKFNSLEKLSTDRSVGFINYNRSEMYNEIDLDFSKDFFNAGHLNVSGAAKMSRHLGSYIKNNFSIPDRRGDKAYETWVISSKIIKNLPLNTSIRTAENTDDFVKSVKENSDIKLYINTVDSTREIAENGFFEKLGINGSALKDGRLYETDNGVLTEISNNKFNWKHVIPLFDEKIIVQQKRLLSDKMTSFNSLFYNGNEYITDRKGTYIAAYDTILREVVAIRQIVCKKNENGCALTLVKNKTIK